MNRLDEIAARNKVPPHKSRAGDPPSMMWPPAPRRLWLDGWSTGWWAGYERAYEEMRELGWAS